MSATENNGHDLLNNNNNQTNKYHVTFEDWNTYLWTTKNTSAPRVTDAALVPKRDEESTICFWIFHSSFIDVEQKHSYAIQQMWYLLLNTIMK